MKLSDSVGDPALAEPLPHDPFPVLARWLVDAKGAGYVNPDAICLSTIAEDGTPRSRMVLCRGLDVERGSLTFYTNRESAKGRQLVHLARATAVFYWDRAARQAIVSGAVTITPEAVSDAYWQSRPRLSQIAARASRQSEPVASRAELLAQIDREAQRFDGYDGSTPVPRPAHWGGYDIVADRVELWVGSTGRAHDRAVWQRNAHDWSRQRLQP
jgi:pyridoxamine 5'-phosphate oxidase